MGMCFDWEKALDAINAFRKELVNRRVRSENANFSKGREMYKMRWNCSLEKMARKKVSECKFGSEYNDDIGETIHTSLEPAISNKPLEDALKNWLKSVENYDGDSLSVCEFTNSFYDFAQIASGSTTNIGCATSICIFQQDYEVDDVVKERKVQFTVRKFWPKQFFFLQRWNCSLEEMAWKKVSKCSYGSSDDEEDEVGEAIYILFRPSGGDFKPLDEPVKEALKDWVKRVQNGFEDNNVSICEFLDIYDTFIQVGKCAKHGSFSNNDKLCEFDYPGNGSSEEKDVEEAIHVPSGGDFRRNFRKKIVEKSEKK
ncbi:unnamed protein product [Dracunculus medinensis]|uniref:SCP domain-containing protein n=1 Tax=Dracunculus medinensis TaxID=318479 RepID=A0A0N4UR05_DRAME|nr:unnamed protein product [Dracunculus medinensis]